MYKNNFDCSSTGINIECCACYDTDLSRIYYDDNFYTVNVTNYTTLTVDKDLGVGNPPRIADVTDFNIKKKANVIGFLDTYSDSFYDNTYSKEELIDIAEQTSCKYLEEMLRNQYVKCKEGYKWFISRGYCQGDRTLVICKEDMSEDYVNHLLWDAPVYARVTIGDSTEYFYAECCDDEYEWDKEKFIKYVCDSYTNDDNVKTKIGKQLSNMLPEELDYV